MDILYYTKLVCGNFTHFFNNGKATKDFNIEADIVLRDDKYKITEIVYEIEENSNECVISTTYITKKVEV